MFKQLADYFVERRLIAESNKLLFTYALEEFVHTVLIVFSIIIVGIWMNSIQEVVIFLLTFPLLRKYIGGIHALNRFTCYITTIYMFLFSLWALDFDNALVLFIFSTIAVKYIYCYAPAERQDWILTLHQKEIYKDSGQKTVLVLWEIGTLLLTYANVRIGKLFFVILILSGVSLFLQRCKIDDTIPLITDGMLRVFAVIMLSFGMMSIHGTCNRWNYQPKLNAEMRKYVDR